MQALLTSLFPWLVFIHTASLALEPFVSPLARSCMRSEKKQYLHSGQRRCYNVEKNSQEGWPRQAETQLTTLGAPETNCYIGGHHCPQGTRVGAFLPCVSSQECQEVV